MTYQGVFVDDEDTVFAETLSTPGSLEIKLVEISEVAELARLIAAKSPALVALDYRLDEAPAGLKPEQTFKGSALAQHLRDNSIERPETDFALVLVSAETKIRTLYRPDKTAHDLFDRVYVKEEINQRRAQIRKELISLCDAYIALRASAGTYDLGELMKAGETDRPFIDVQELRLKVVEAKVPHVIVRMVLGLLIDRPGPLIEIEDACAHLGVSIDDAAKLETLLSKAEAQYKGLFADAWPRWWNHRIEEWSQAQFGRRATGMPASDRARVLSEKYGVAFTPARSPWTNSPNELVAIACACCRRGVEMRHSVAAFEQNLPRFSTRRRICWDCVQTDKYETTEPPLVIDETDKDLAADIKVMAKPTVEENL